MDPEFAKLLNNTLPGALSVCLGCLPLLGVIAWFSYQQGDRMRRMEQHLDRLDQKMDRMDQKMDNNTAAIAALVTEVRVINQRVVTLEDLIRPQIVKG
jgi:hypothetical protein